jgi:exopolysaccharide biosynthesis polyprenyl glycosylphosphotransferase
MIRRHLMVLRLALMVVDALSAAFVFALVSLVRFGDGDAAELWRQMGIDIRLAAVLFGTSWVLALQSLGLYRLRVRWRLLTEAQDIAKATFLVLAITLSTLFILHEAQVSRLFLALLFVTQPLVTLAGRILLRYIFGALRRRGFNTRYMLVVGTGVLAQNFADRVEGRPALGVRVVGHVSVPGVPEGIVSRPVLGSLGMTKAIFHSRVIDEVAVCLPPRALHHLEPVSRLAADEGKTVRIPLDPMQELLPSSHQEEFEGFLVRSLVRDDQRAFALMLKRLIDIAGAAVGLILLSPVFLLTAVAIRLREGSPVLFRQTRVALHGRPFTIYKFRTMTTDAEVRRSEMTHLNERVGAAFKVANDPRVTRLGLTLRKTSIDELPQLWNVLKGEMSLVGPRPPLPDEVNEYDVWHRRRLSMKPGMTGLWQVESRQEPSFDRWVERDLSYIDRWSLGLDLEILLRTVPAVLIRTGR